jgi:PAS domain S-box-containing protein
MTFRGKLLFVFSMIASSGVVLSSLLTHRSASKRLGSAAQTEMERTAALIARQSRTTLDIFASGIRSLAREDCVRQAILRPRSASKVNVVCRRFQEIAQEAKVYQSINLHDRDARCVASSFPDRVGLESMQRDVAERPDFLSARKGETAISQIFLSRGTGRPVIVITAPVEIDGTVPGVVRAVVDLTYFNDYVLAPQDYVHGGKAYVFDPMLDREVPESWGAHNVIEAREYEQPDIPIPDDMHARGSGFVRYPSSRGEQLAAFCKTPQPEWYFVVEKPREDTMKPIHAMGRVTAGTLVSMLFGVWGGALAVARPLLTRLGRCIDLARDIEAGHLDRRVEVRGTDEVAFLGRGLNAMADSLEESHAALEEAERLYRGIFENAVEGIFIMDPVGRLLNVNPAFARLVGCEGPAEVMGNNIADYCGTDAGLLLLGELRGSGSVRGLEVELVRRDGTTRTGIIDARADRDRAGALIRVQGLLNDITERKEVEEERHRAEEAQRRFVEAQLETLRYQINPHFLFNVLNSLDALSRTDPGRITELVQQLSRYLRSTLSSRESGLTPLKREMSTIESYLSLEKVRFEEDLDVSVSMPGEIGDTMVPELLVQPIVENAVKHGMKTSALPLRVDVACRAAGEYVRIEITNTGKWITRDASAGAGKGGIGLENIRTRLKLTYGDRHGLDIGESGDRVVVAIEIPRGGEKNEKGL